MKKTVILKKDAMFNPIIYPSKFRVYAFHRRTNGVDSRILRLAKESLFTVYSMIV
ncbi:MAG: hypothetical protein MK086_12140 [Flavobacteriales bacterium]|nr:hypothetical protein [Flavobacteriales bacterium]